MANANAVNSMLPNAMMKLTSLFSTNSGFYSAARHNQQFETIKQIGLLNNAIQNPIFKGGVCQAVEFVFLKDCTALGAYTCETAIATCDIPTAGSPTSHKQTYAPDCFITEKFELNDDLCGNAFQFEEFFSKKMFDAITRLRARANRKAIADLAANAQANIDTDGTATITGATITGTRTDIVNARWSDPRLLIQLEDIAKFNGLGNYFIVDSRNLTVHRSYASHGAGVNQNNAVADSIYNDYIFFDNPRDVKTVTTRDSTFFVDMDMIGLLHRNNYANSAPNQVLGGNNSETYTWSMPDPEWSYREAITDTMGNVSAYRSTPIRYDIEHQMMCNERDGRGRRTYLHRYLISLNIKPIFAPVHCDNGTGILHFAKVADA